MSEPIRVAALPARRVVVVRHDGPLEEVDVVRRPLYQHLIQHELVGGPSYLRFSRDDAGANPAGADVLVEAASGDVPAELGDVGVLPAGEHAVLDFDGAVDALADERQRLLDWAADAGFDASHVLQMHVMDEYDGTIEAQLQVALVPRAAN